MDIGSHALVDLELAREYVLRSSTDDSGDEKLIFLINSKSRSVQRYLQRELKPAASGARKFAYNGRGVLNLGKYELRAVTSIVLYTDRTVAEQQTLSGTAPAEYRLEPRNKTDFGTYLWLRLPKLALSGEERRFGVEVTITASWGADLVHEDVAEATLIAIKAAYDNPRDAGSEQIGEYSFVEGTEAFSSDRSVALPRRARSILYPHKRNVLAS